MAADAARTPCSDDSQQRDVTVTSSRHRRGGHEHQRHRSHRVTVNGRDYEHVWPGSQR